MSGDPDSGARAVSVDTSVVVAACSGEARLRRCLESLEPQSAGSEVIVACDQPAEGLAARFGSYRFVVAPAGSDVFRLRALGLAQASGGLVALTEGHCTVAPGWLASLREAHHAGHAVVGGAVEAGPGGGLFSWALYLAEYAAYMPPLPTGPTDSLLAVNIAYDRALLEACRDTWAGAFYENEVQDALAGQALRVVPQAEVQAHLAQPLLEACAHFFRCGRRYGKHRRARSSRVVRTLLALGAVALPALLILRIVATVARRQPRRLPRLVVALPFLTVLETAWAAGEFCGYVGGRHANRG